MDNHIAVGENRNLRNALTIIFTVMEDIGSSSRRSTKVFLMASFMKLGIRVIAPSL